MRNVPKAIIILWMTICTILCMPHGLVLAAPEEIQLTCSHYRMGSEMGERWRSGLH